MGIGPSSFCDVGEEVDAAQQCPHCSDPNCNDGIELAVPDPGFAGVVGIEVGGLGVGARFDGYPDPTGAHALVQLFVVVLAYGDGCPEIMLQKLDFDQVQLYG